MMAYWPWWLGAIGLTSISLLYFFLIGRLLGVSGSWAKVVFWREQQALHKENETLHSQGTEAINSTLIAETLAEFGEDAVAELGITETPHQEKQPAIEKESRWTSHLTFLVSIFVGSLLVSIFTGHFEVRFNLSDIHSQIFGNLWEVWLALFFGGAMVGFGTQMAGGCTSGHGLSGSARMIPASLLSTFVFVLSAVSLSLLMKEFIS
ncbi:hypothetical protein MNBD_GAMMA23-837 [hydrothermal vent metagenome]|uniref:Uncharacterized protein n=1 Tax=hydrothermal vent metagenome TaxID=652676 RepID=A0A3B1A0B1_9ZZZZ